MSDDKKKPQACRTDVLSSRVCESGTRTCNVRHNEDERPASLTWACPCGKAPAWWRSRCERCGRYKKPRVEPRDCDCDDGTDADEPADRGFVCEHEDGGRPCPDCLMPLAMGCCCGVRK